MAKALTTWRRRTPIRADRLNRLQRSVPRGFAPGEGLAVLRHGSRVSLENTAATGHPRTPGTLAQKIMLLTAGPNESGLYSGRAQIWDAATAAMINDPADDTVYGLEFYGAQDELPSVAEATIYILATRVGYASDGDPVYKVFLGIPGKFCFVAAPV